MKKIAVALCSVIFVMCAVFLSACGGDGNTKKVSSVNANNLKQVYSTTEEINFNAITITVNYDDKSKETLTKGEFDIEVADAKADTQFIIYTDGLYAQTAGEREKRDYDFSCKIIGNEKTYQLGKVSVADSLSIDYDVLTFAEPDFVSKYKVNSTTSNTDESAFYKGATYMVGDDNAFKFKPILTLRAKNAPYGILVAEDYDVNVAVEIKNGSAFEALNDETYFTYDNFAFAFKNVAIGETFKIKMSLADFTQDFAGNPISTVEFTIQVADGWNAYEAKDLGRMSLVSNTLKKTFVEAGIDKPSSAVGDLVIDQYIRSSSANVFYNGSNGRKHIRYYDIWEKYFGEIGETNLAPINGLFVHGDISVTPADLPTEFFISQAEVNANGLSNALIGSLRDFSLIYSHYMDNDFYFNGNLFKLDFSAIPWGLSNTATTGYYYRENESQINAGHSTVFNFLNTIDESGDTKARFENAEFIGNTRDIISGGSGSANWYEDPLMASGGLILLKSISGTTVVDNCIAKSFLIGWYAETTMQKNGLEMTYVKTYDCFNSGMFSWRSEKSTLANSEFKRFGGPVMMLVSGAEKGEKISGTGWTIDKDTTTLESYVDGTEAWFTMQGASSIATQLFQLDVAMNINGSTFKKDGKVNMVTLVFDDGYLTSSERILYVDFSLGDSKLVMNNDTQDADNVYNLLNQTGFKTPILMSNGGDIACPNGKTDGSNPLTFIKGTSFTGDKLYIAYPLMNTVAMVVLDLAPYVA